MLARMVRCSRLVALIVCLSACATSPESVVDMPRVNLSNVAVVGLGFKSQTFLLSFDVANPNSFPLPVSNIDYGIRLNGHRFASGETVCDFTIPAGGDASFAISVDLNLLHTAPQVLAIVRDGTRHAIDYQLEGQLSIDIPLMPSIGYRNSGKIRFVSDVL